MADVKKTSRPLTKNAIVDLIKGADGSHWNSVWGSRTVPTVGDSAKWYEKLGSKLFNSDAAKRAAFNDYTKLVENGVSEDVAKSKILEFYNTAAKSPFSSEKSDLVELATKLDDGSIQKKTYRPSALGRTASVATEYAKAHPGQVLGTAATTAGSLAGLFDNDKIGGQLVATGLGAAVPKLLGMKLNPLMAYNVAAGAGSLGALFDKLREKKADERAAMANNPYGREEYVR